MTKEGPPRRRMSQLPMMSLSLEGVRNSEENVLTPTSLFRPTQFGALPYNSTDEARHYFDTTMTALSNVRNGKYKLLSDNRLASQYPDKNRYMNIYPYLRTLPTVIYSDRFLLTGSRCGSRASIPIPLRESSVTPEQPDGGTPKASSIVPTHPPLADSADINLGLYQEYMTKTLVIRYFNGNIVVLNGITFLITQAPTISSIPDFWYIVAKLHVSFIACLTRFADDDRPKALRYWPLYKAKEQDPLYDESVLGSYLFYAYQRAQQVNQPRRGQMFNQHRDFVDTVRDEIPEASLFWNSPRMRITLNTALAADNIAASAGLAPNVSQDTPDDDTPGTDDEDLFSSNANILNIRERSARASSVHTPSSPARTGQQALVLHCAAMRKYKDNFVGYKVSVKCEKELHYSKIYYYGLWSDYSAPENFEQIFVFTIEALRYKKRTPLCLHCSAGVGRSSTFAICIVLTDMLLSHFRGTPFVKSADIRDACIWRSLKPSIIDMVETLRVERNPICVQTCDQFIFLHEYCNFVFFRLRDSLATASNAPLDA